MLFLDTEFNGFGGQLISIAIVSDQSRDELYVVRDLPSNMHPWVKEHVVPYLLQSPSPDYILKDKLVNYLNKHRGEVIVADWPEDFIHLLALLCEPNGVQYNVGDLKLQLIRQSDPVPLIPHNAVSDARALRDWYVANNKNNSQE